MKSLEACGCDAIDVARPRIVMEIIDKPTYSPLLQPRKGEPLAGDAVANKINSYGLRDSCLTCSVGAFKDDKSSCEIKDTTAVRVSFQIGLL